ncbi:MAG: hypothetical protein RLN87_13460 [Parasphingopyxis sp.]|uniref:hypothetical protein n=1 Tax=Parasphingopyxis sp. TaxID=1920299 RepID=UPI0026022CDD|nr:hypothetical protein [uncultured Parasphingopyxis sp.]
MRFTSIAAAALACTSLAAAAPAFAQDGDQIVVTGAPSNPQAVADFVGAISSRTSDGHIARWNSPLCPRVTGLRDELNGYIAQTVTAIAEAVGARTGSDGCDPNAIIVFMREPAEFVETLRRQRPAHLSSLNIREREALAESGAAARSWSVNEFRTRDGRIVRSQDGNNTDSDLVLGGSQGRASRISNELRADFSTVYLLIDLDQLEGVTMQQLSAFVAVQALTAADVTAPIRPERTILNLFRDGVDAPADLTDWDVAYLRALYGTEGAAAAETQRGQISGQMRELLTASASD